MTKNGKKWKDYWVLWNQQMLRWILKCHHRQSGASSDTDIWCNVSGHVPGLLFSCPVLLCGAIPKLTPASLYFRNGCDQTHQSKALLAWPESSLLFLRGGWPDSWILCCCYSSWRLPLWFYFQLATKWYITVALWGYGHISHYKYVFFLNG